MGDESLIEAINTMLCCTPLECSKESHCLLVAKKLRDLLELHQPHEIAPEPDPDLDPDDVMHYAPTCWEWSGC